MTISEYRKLQKLEQEKNKLLPMQKISNNFLDNTIFKNNSSHKWLVSIRPIKYSKFLAVRVGLNARSDIRS